MGLRPLVQFAKTYAASVIVEGIETESDAQLARQGGATGLQGYLYSGPSAPLSRNVHKTGFHESGRDAEHE